MSGAVQSLVAASDRPMAWWSQAQLASFAQRMAPAWTAWCDDWGLAPGPVEAFNAAQTPTDVPGPAGWQPLEGVPPGIAWMGFVMGDPVLVIGTLLFGARSGLDTLASETIAEEVARRAVRALAQAFAQALTDGVPARRTVAALGHEAPPQRDSRAWSGALRMVARFGGMQRGAWLHVSPERAFAWANADTSLQCREPGPALRRPGPAATIPACSRFGPRHDLVPP